MSKEEIIEAKLKEYKDYYEANIIDGDDVYDCGKSMVLAEDVFEVIQEWITATLNEVLLSEKE